MLVRRGLHRGAAQRSFEPSAGRSDSRSEAVSVESYTEVDVDCRIACRLLSSDNHSMVAEALISARVTLQTADVPESGVRGIFGSRLLAAKR